MEKTKTEEILESVYDKLDSMTTAQIIQGADDADSAMQNWQELKHDIEAADSLIQTLNSLDESFETFTELVYVEIITQLGLIELNTESDYGANELINATNDDLLNIARKLSDISFKLIRFVNQH